MKRPWPGQPVVVAPRPRLASQAAQQQVQELAQAPAAWEPVRQLAVQQQAWQPMPQPLAHGFALPPWLRKPVADPVATASAAEALSKAAEKALSARGAPRMEGESTICTFGFACRRIDCWWVHPQGRQIDANPGLSVCRYGVDCPNKRCFFFHPDGRHIDPAVFEIFLDELPMPQRPHVPPAAGNTEVFMDFFEQDPDSASFRDAMSSAYGGVKSIRKIPGSTKGYVSFEDQRAAKKCVEEQAGTWSESERCTAESSWSNRKSWDRGPYGMDLAKLIIGKKGKNLNDVVEKLGDGAKLHFNTDDGYAAFKGKVAKSQLTDLRALLAEVLAAAHSEIGASMRQVEVDKGLPKAFTHDEASDLFKAFGTIESLDLTDPDPDDPAIAPKACVVYEASEEALRAVSDLHAAIFFGTPLSCSLRPAGSTDDRKRSQWSKRFPDRASRKGWTRLRWNQTSDGGGDSSEHNGLGGSEYFEPPDADSGDNGQHGEAAPVAGGSSAAEDQGESVWFCSCGYQNDEGALVCGEFADSEGCGQPRDA
ncbi:unnamed protein product [Prorocentrum cordatum]|uniref:RRM domain-containing protein n=1 Tax=Prorocentrum cordatum TaxID=2364126 RepID=A0ABN9QBK9_9DINO|nr:unnamed protein product [Polarella glacialis]